VSCGPVSLSDDTDHSDNPPPSLQNCEQAEKAPLPAEGASLKDLVESYEREVIIDALKKSRGNAAAAARHLRTTERIINYRIKKLGIDPQQYRWAEEGGR
jgi:Nif-specific regulatory protein